MLGLDCCPQQAVQVAVHKTLMNASHRPGRLAYASRPWYAGRNHCSVCLPIRLVHSYYMRPRLPLRWSGVTHLAKHGQQASCRAIWEHAHTSKHQHYIGRQAYDKRRGGALPRMACRAIRAWPVQVGNPTRPHAHTRARKAFSYEGAQTGHGMCWDGQGWQGTHC